MQFSEAWLREWLSQSISINPLSKLAQQLTMLGFEVENVQKVAPDFNQVVIGEILETIQHPNADRLKVCTVNVGQSGLLKIVCGAPNARAGIKVAVALIGAQLPHNINIKKTQLRGIESEGMICSASELGLEDQKDGIMELAPDAPIGMNVREYLELDDYVIDVNITPNRGDCLSIQGIARELVAAQKTSFISPTIQSVPVKHAESFPVTVLSPKDCPLYTYRIIKNIKPSVLTPVWMQERLKRSGIRSIHPIVDITNYVMLELGQPMHAFDLSRLEGGMFIRHAKENEKITLLDGKTIELKVGTLIISDQKNVHALAGVMGGNIAMVNEATQDLFLESAFFDSLAIRRSVSAYNLHTDSSQRFERGVDYELSNKAIERATQLIVSLMGGEPGPIHIVESTEHIKDLTPILLRKHQIQRILGFSIPDEDVNAILQALHIKLKETPEGWEVLPPSYRFDLKIESDFIEELARIYGYDNIPLEKTISYTPLSTLSLPSVDSMKLRQIIANQGYHESISYSFIAKEYHHMFTPEQEMIILANPISQDMSVMRASLWPGLIKSFLYNQNRQQNRIRLFEIGVCFTRENQVLMQREKIAGLISGSCLPEQWAEKNRNVDFYDGKGDLEKLFISLGCTQPEFIPNHFSQVLHPGQSASLVFGNEILGYYGALHPHIANVLKINVPLYLFELEIAVITDHLKKKVFEPLSKFPAIHRDVSLIVDKTLSWKELKEKISLFPIQDLSAIKLFDIYEGKPIPPDKKSVSVTLIFQSNTQTLVETEVNQRMEKFLDFLRKTINVTLRD